MKAGIYSLLQIKVFIILKTKSKNYLVVGLNKCSSSCATDYQIRILKVSDFSEVTRLNGHTNIITDLAITNV